MSGLDIYEACAEGDVERVKYLISKGIEINDIGRFYNTPLDLAVARNRLEVITELIKAGADVNHSDRHGNTSLHNIIEDLYKDEDKFHNEDKVHNKILNILLATDIDIDKKNNDGMSALHIACDDRHRHPSTVLKLIDAGADINLTCTDAHFTPLHFCCNDNLLSIQTSTDCVRYERRMAVVQLLLDCDGINDINKPTKSGQTPLHMVCSKTNHDNIVVLLIERGANINQVNVFSGYTALMYACKAGHLKNVQALLTNNRNHVTSSHLYQKLDLYIKNDDGATALEIAKSEGNILIVEALEREINWERRRKLLLMKCHTDCEKQKSHKPTLLGNLLSERVSTESKAIVKRVGKYM